METNNSAVAPSGEQEAFYAFARAGSPRPVVSLRTYALAAAASGVCQAASASEAAPEIRFLLEHLRAVDPNRKGWATTLYSYFSQPAAIDAPLIRLAEQMSLTVIEMLAVSLAASVEDDIMAGRALARLQAPLGGSRPTLGLLAVSLDATAPVGTRAIDALVTGAAVESGLLSLTGESAPLPERALSVPLPLCLALNDIESGWQGMTIGLGDIPAVPLPPTTMEEAGRQAAALESSRGQALVLRAGSVAEGKSVASWIAQVTNRRALFIETDRVNGLGPWLTLRHLMPVFCFDLAPGERRRLPSLTGYNGPVLALCGHDGSVEAAGGAALSWSLAVPPVYERQQLWEIAVGSSELAADLARNHRHGSGRIAHLGRLAHHRKILSGGALPTREDIAAVSWVTEGAGLDALAEALTDRIDDEALVVSSLLKNELNNLLLRCRARDHLASGLGASATARYHAGVRSLFVGPSGTGKTLAAGWLATKLGLPVYRVDLAAVTSKYIGETEKNLAQLLARAEQAEVLLLFDEADSIFGKRTDVKDSTDRFANSQTNYLLQRIEAFDGITLLTSNSRSRFDTAFSRRLDAIIDFPLPGPEERRALWQSHLGLNHQLSNRDLNQLAATADLCGGHIRNAVFTAAVLAQAESRAISYTDIAQGLMSEYRKLGRQMPVELKTKL